MILPTFLVLCIATGTISGNHLQEWKWLGGDATRMFQESQSDDRVGNNLPSRRIHNTDEVKDRRAIFEPYGYFHSDQEVEVPLKENERRDAGRDQHGHEYPKPPSVIFSEHLHDSSHQHHKQPENQRDTRSLRWPMYPPYNSFPYYIPAMSVPGDPPVNDQQRSTKFREMPLEQRLSTQGEQSDNKLVNRLLGNTDSAKGPVMGRDYSFVPPLSSLAKERRSAGMTEDHHQAESTRSNVDYAAGDDMEKRYFYGANSVYRPYFHAMSGLFRPYSYPYRYGLPYYGRRRKRDLKEKRLASRSATDFDNLNAEDRYGLPIVAADVDQDPLMMMANVVGNPMIMAPAAEPYFMAPGIIEDPMFMPMEDAGLMAPVAQPVDFEDPTLLAPGVVAEPMMMSPVFDSYPIDPAMMGSGDFMLRRKRSAGANENVRSKDMTSDKILKRRRRQAMFNPYMGYNPMMGMGMGMGPGMGMGMYPGYGMNMYPGYGMGMSPAYGMGFGLGNAYSMMAPHPLAAFHPLVASGVIQ